MNATRIFNHYAERLAKEAGASGKTRMNAIEYLCSFPKIDPVKMAAHLIRNGYTVLFDDSAISQQENRRKETEVYKLAENPVRL